MDTDVHSLDSAHIMRLIRDTVREMNRLVIAAHNIGVIVHIVPVTFDIPGPDIELYQPIHE